MMGWADLGYIFKNKNENVADGREERTLCF